MEKYIGNVITFLITLGTSVVWVARRDTTHAKDIESIERRLEKAALATDLEHLKASTGKKAEDDHRAFHDLWSKLNETFERSLNLEGRVGTLERLERVDDRLEKIETLLIELRRSARS